ncbi:membrane protein DedA with SNARE-associated domain [Paenibacillus sp. OAS669]|nr:membrane protein DedA with SNARE-associated domain [Paenibacillus sp. OAS669]
MLKDLIHSALMFIQDLGVWGILIGLMLEVIPSEIVLSYGGYLVSQGSVSFLGAIIFGTLGCLIQQVFLYWIGRYGGRPFIEKYGKYIHLKMRYINIAEDWFNRYGAGMVFTARFIPVVRQAISIPAGMARMPMMKFLFYTLLGTIPWAVLFVYLGNTLGSNWEHIDEYASKYTTPLIIGSVALTVLYVLFKLLRRKKSEPKYGDEGEKSTAHQLKYIGSEYRVLNSRHVRAGGSSQEFDHIVIGPNGVFHIDSKHWSGEIVFTSQGVERSKEGHSADPTAQLYRHEHILKELFRSAKLNPELVGVLCFTHPNSHIVGKSPAFATVKLDRLAHLIKTHKSKKPLLTASEVTRIEQLIKENSHSSK